MIEPTIALQTTIRSRLLDRPAVTALVVPENIRAGSTRPDKTPAIILGEGTTKLHGHDYTAQRAAWVNLDIHVWTLDQGQEAAKAIAFAITQALDSKWKLQIDGGYCDHFEVKRVVYARDPDPRYGHAVLSVEALIRWIV
ncbi:MAG: DUF3168 domain-containing protein [Mesorhizobium sp.]|nr:MAG: DUF3168 domain-containing protein [Mesorhizobium sp.]